MKLRLYVFNFLKNVFGYLKKNVFNLKKIKYVLFVLILSTSFFGTKAYYEYIYNKDFKKFEAFMYEIYGGRDRFVLSTIPDGIVISIIGISETRDTLLLALPNEFKYHKFMVGIFNGKTLTVYRVEVPLYAISMFTLGKPVITPNLMPNNPDKSKKPKFFKINNVKTTKTN